MHPKIGFDILSKSDKLKHIAEIVLCHHERWVGKGYPNGLTETDIPLGSRIISVCDFIDTMKSDKEAMSFERCINEIIKNKCLMFDPVVVEFIEDNLDFMRGIVNLK